MKLFSSKRRMAIVGLTVALIAGASGLAAAYFTSTGNGTGSAQVGTESPVLINQIGGTPIYNSRINAAAYQFSQCFYCVGMTQLGNKITFAGDTGGPLNNVTVDMANFGTTAGPMNITFNIYASNGSTLLATDEQSFNIPAAPNGGYGSTYCTTGAGASDPYCGIGNFSITFDFSSQHITLPATIVYGLQYNDAQNAVNGGVNVQLANENSNISVGTDADPGNLFAQTASGGNGDTGGSTGEITCSDITPGFNEYSTAATASCRRRSLRAGRGIRLRWLQRPLPRGTVPAHQLLGDEPRFDLGDGGQRDDCGRVGLGIRPQSG